MSVIIDRHFDDTPESTKEFYSKIGSLDLIKAGSVFEIDFSRCGYLGPVAVSCIAGVIRYLHLKNVEIKIIAPELEVLRGYCEYSGLLQLANIGPPPTSHPDNVTIPVREFKTFDQEGIDNIVSLVNKFIPMTEDTESVLRQGIAEVIQNVLDHSKSEVGGFMSARAFTNIKVVKIAIYDVGVGILNSLNKRYPNVKIDKIAMQTAFSKGGSAKTFERNQGMGLKYLKDLVFYNRGLFVLYSGSCFARCTDRRDIEYQGNPWDPKIPGTLAILHFKIDNELYSGDSEPVADIEV